MAVVRYLVPDAQEARSSERVPLRVVLRDRELLRLMGQEPRFVSYLDMPLQHSHPEVLKAMRRTYSRERYLRLVGELCAAIPDLALTTDLIVGFPGETEAEFEETISAVEEVGYDGAFTFVYSLRQGTEAASMADQVPEDVKRERIERLIEVVQRVAEARNRERIGRVEEVLVEGPSRTDASLLRGRTRRNTTVNFAGTASAGELAPVTIEAATSTTLKGTQLAAVAA